MILAVGVVAVLILVVAGSVWSLVNGLNGRLTRADVISSSSWSLAGDQNILMVGLDTRTDAQGQPLPPAVLDALHAGGASDGGDTDTMIVVHLPAGGGQATGFSIPRDSYVDIPGYGKHKINSAYTYGQNTARTMLARQGLSGPALAVQSAAAGARTAIATVAQLTGLRIDHYAAVNLAGFYDISQAVGGVPVCLAAPVDDSFSGAHFPAGPQTVQGAAALAFVRQRHGLPRGDLDRERRQQEFVSSMAHTVLSSGTLTSPSTLTTLIDAVSHAMVVDQGFDLLDLTTAIPGLTGGSLGFQTIPIVSASVDTPDDGQAVQVDPAQVQTFLHTAIDPPTTTPPPSGTSGAGPSGSGAPPGGTSSAPSTASPGSAATTTASTPAPTAPTSPVAYIN